MGLFGPDAAPSPYDAMLGQVYTPAMRQQALYQGLLGLGGGLLMAGAPTTQPGRSAQGYLAGAGAMNHALQAGPQMALHQAQVSSTIQSQAAQRRRQLMQQMAFMDPAEREAFIKANPELGGPTPGPVGMGGGIPTSGGGNPSALGSGPAPDGAPRGLGPAPEAAPAGTPQGAPTGAAPGAAVALNKNPLLAMLPDNLRAQVQAIGMADPEKGFKLLGDITLKQFEQGRWEVRRHPTDPNGAIMVDMHTGKMQALPLSFAQQLMNSRAGATNVGVKIDTGGGVKLAELAAGHLAELGPQVAQANSGLAQIQHMRDAMQAYKTGFAGETGLKVRQVLQAAGVNTSAPAGEFFSATAARARLGDIPKGLSPVSNYEGEVLKQAAPNLTLTEEGNLLLLSAKEALLKRTIQEAQIAREEYTKMAERPEGSRDLGLAHMRTMERIAQLPPPYSPEVSARLQAAGQARSGGSATSTPAEQEWVKQPDGTYAPKRR